MAARQMGYITRRRRVAENQWKRQARDVHGRWTVKDEEKRRGDMLRIRLTSDEHDALMLYAEARGMTVTRYIVECCLEEPRRARQQPRDMMTEHRNALRRRAMRRR